MQITINMRYILILLLLLPLRAFAVESAPIAFPIFIQRLQIAGKFVKEAMNKNCSANTLRCLILKQDVALLTEYFQMLNQGKSAKDLNDDLFPNLTQQENNANIQIIDNFMVLALNNKGGSTSTVYIPKDLNLQQQKDYLVKRNSILRDLFAANESVNKVDGLGLTPLHYAAATNSNQMVDLLVSFGAKAYKSNNELALKPDAIAVIAESNLIISKLMTICGREEINSQREFNLLSYYSYFGRDINILDQIYNFNFGTSNPNLTDKYGNTPAFYAALANNPDFLEYFIQNKHADPNVINADGKTMLIYVATYGYDQAAKILLRLKANPNIEDFSKCTAISYAFMKKDYNTARLLFDSGADIEIFDRHNMSPMFYAIEANNTYVLDLFLNRHSCGSGKSPSGLSPLAFALENGYYESALYLINAGCDVNTPLPDGLTPLILAAGNGKLQVVQALIAKGANPNLPSKTNNSALFYALSSSDWENIAIFLIKNGADALMINDSGMTVAGYAALNGKHTIVRAVVDHKAEFKSLLAEDKIEELAHNLCASLSDAYFGPCLYNVRLVLLQMKLN